MSGNAKENRVLTTPNNRSNTCSEMAITKAAQKLFDITLTFGNTNNDKQVDLNPIFGAFPSDRDLNCSTEALSGKSERALKAVFSALDPTKTYMARTGTNNGSGHFQTIYYQAPNWRVWSSETNQGTLYNTSIQAFPDQSDPESRYHSFLSPNETWGSRDGQRSIMIYEMTPERTAAAAHYIAKFRSLSDAETDLPQHQPEPLLQELLTQPHYLDINFVDQSGYWKKNKPADIRNVANATYVRLAEQQISERDATGALIQLQKRNYFNNPESGKSLLNATLKHGSRICAAQILQLNLVDDLLSPDSTSGLTPYEAATGGYGEFRNQDPIDNPSLTPLQNKLLDTYLASNPETIPFDIYEAASYLNLSAVMKMYQHNPRGVDITRLKDAIQEGLGRREASESLSIECNDLITVLTQIHTNPQFYDQPTQKVALNNRLQSIDTNQHPMAMLLLNEHLMPNLERADSNNLTPYQAVLNQIQLKNEDARRRDIAFYTKQKKPIPTQTDPIAFPGNTPLFIALQNAILYQNPNQTTFSIHDACEALNAHALGVMLQVNPKVDKDALRREVHEAAVACGKDKEQYEPLLHIIDHHQQPLKVQQSTQAHSQKSSRKSLHQTKQSSMAPDQTFAHALDNIHDKEENPAAAWDLVVTLFLQQLDFTPTRREPEAIPFTVQDPTNQQRITISVSQEVYEKLAWFQARAEKYEQKILQKPHKNISKIDRFLATLLRLDDMADMIEEHSTSPDELWEKAFHAFQKFNADQPKDAEFITYQAQREETSPSSAPKAIPKEAALILDHLFALKLQDDFNMRDSTHHKPSK